MGFAFEFFGNFFKLLPVVGFVYALPERTVTCLHDYGIPEHFFHRVERLRANVLLGVVTEKPRKRRGHRYVVIGKYHGRKHFIVARFHRVMGIEKTKPALFKHLRNVFILVEIYTKIVLVRARLQITLSVYIRGEKIVAPYFGAHAHIFKFRFQAHGLIETMFEF